MIKEEWEKATLFRVIDQTLLEYLQDCKRDGHEKDRCGYIGQITEKVKEEVNVETAVSR